ncbi:hypothetical protein H5S40_07700 [Limosilactobacillus sp. RRLNB_1_1]|uniref:HTH marR-type domain-containing protein n=1 Tax=Limosilactobacillus albertensis TaxID=2759752 RepID=A0A7W3Y921_9LACO|nr:hypothetical protein [Limosilactobacillus albertensis]MBB1070033.1 hypothetical protein [Limosilactobacillus albertensis]MCD7117270.1 hypothetical protein [Limosilactobacillus albertensis]MCD7128874.1 hypothetical protein [Limosilactobacillus albertensis]
MSELTTKLFLDIKDFEKYQAMLKCHVHIEEERRGEYCLSGYPDRHNYHRLLRILRGHNDGLLSHQLIYDFDYRPSELSDATKALVANNLATTSIISDEEYKIRLTDEGIEAADKLLSRRDNIAEAAYHTLSNDEQRELDNLINKLLEDYKNRNVNYTALKNICN